MTTIHASQDYLLHVTVKPVPSTQQQHLLIESQWLGAKHPVERQTKLSLVLPAIEMSRIAKAIQEAA